MSANITKQPREAKKDTDPNAKPEAMVLGVGAWFVALALEGLQQLLNLGASFFNMGRLRAQVVKIGEQQGQEWSDSMITAVSVSALVFSLVLSLAVLGAIAYFVHKVNTRGRNADSLQQLLSFFAGYLLFKAIMVTFTPPVGDLPVAYYALSGVLQIVVGVSAVVGAVLINRKESVDWVAGEKKGDKGSSLNANNDQGKSSSTSLFSSLLGNGKAKDEPKKPGTAEDEKHSEDEGTKK